MTAPSAAKKTTAPKPTVYVTDLVFQEVIDSLNGWDELVIENHLKTPIESIGSNYTLLRAAIAIHLTREGAKEAAAWKQAMEMTNAEVQKYFTPPGKNDDDAMVGPTSESGKGAPA